MPVHDENKKESEKKEEHMIPKSRLDEVLDRELKAKERADELERKLIEVEKQQLEATNNYKQLYENSQAELAKVKPIAGTVEESTKALGLVLAAQVLEIPETHRALIPSELPVVKQLEWIAKNKTLLSKTRPTDIGVGSGSFSEDNSAAPVLSEEEAAFARSYGMKPEEYIKNK